MEEVVQGYCRASDGARSVWIEDGEADCNYLACPHKNDCPIAKQIYEIINNKDSGEI